MLEARRQVLCPRCGGNMVYMIEVEWGNSKRLRYYYKCVLCGNKIEDLTIVVRRKGNGVVELEALEARRELRYPLNVVKASIARRV